MTRISSPGALMLLLAVAACATPRGGTPTLTAGVPVLRPCPDWSRASQEDFTNRDASNFGCADAVNFHAQLAEPADAGRGRGGSAGDAAGAATAIDRLRARLPSAFPGGADAVTPGAKARPGA